MVAVPHVAPCRQGSYRVPRDLDPVAVAPGGLFCRTGAKSCSRPPTGNADAARWRRCSSLTVVASDERRIQVSFAGRSVGARLIGGTGRMSWECSRGGQHLDMNRLVLGLPAGCGQHAGLLGSAGGRVNPPTFRGDVQRSVPPRVGSTPPRWSGSPRTSASRPANTAQHFVPKGARQARSCLASSGAVRSSAVPGAVRAAPPRRRPAPSSAARRRPRRAARAIRAGSCPAAAPPSAQRPDCAWENVRTALRDTDGSVTQPSNGWLSASA